MAVPAAADGRNSIPPDGGEGPGSVIDTATAVLDGQGRVLLWSAGARRLLGYAAGDVTGRPAAMLLASDLPASARRCLAEQRTWNGRVSLRHMDGGRLDLELLAHPSRGSDGSLRWILASFTEGQPGAGTRRAQPDAPFMDWAFTQSPFALAIHDRDMLCLGVNDRMCQMFGLTEDELRGRRLTDVLPGPQHDAIERYMRQVLDTGESAQRSTYRRVPGETRERAWSVSVSPLKDEVGRTEAVWIGVLDITEQYRARQRLTLLNEAGTHVGTTLDVTRTAQELADMVVPRLADLAVVDLLDAVFSGDEPSPGPLIGTIALRRVAHQSIFEGVPEAVVKPGDIDVHPESFPSARCLATGKAVLTGVDDPTFMPSTGHNPARAAIIRKYGIHSVLSVPIRARGVTLGVAVFLRGQRPEPFEQDDVLLAEELTARAGLSLDNARRYTRERTTALALQRSLLPQRLPRQSAVEVASRYLPASAQLGVGGDWFDVIPLSGARVALVVGDVVGHGIHASATMGRLRTAVRTLADVDLPPDELLTRLDDLVIRLSADADADDGDDAESDVGATCLYAVYDPVSRRCSLARAGHPLPALVTPDGTASFLDLPAGPPLGLGGLPFESTEIELPPGSILALYTDGLIESRYHDIDQGFERLRRALTHQERSLETTCDNVLKAVLPDRPADDVALLIARTYALDSDQVATWDLPADPAVVADARRKVAQKLASWGLHDGAFTTGLVVSELVTNAIRHAESPIQLRLIRDRTLICEVSDGSSTAPHLRRACAFDEGGRGLLLVSQLTQRWGTRQTLRGKTIWAEQALPGRGAGDDLHLGKRRLGDRRRPGRGRNQRGPWAVLVPGTVPCWVHWRCGVAGYRRGIGGCALCVVLLAAGCAGPAGEPQAARTQQAPRGTAPAASPSPAGIWLSSLQMTSASTGWALRWTVSPRSAQAGYLVPARTTDGARTWTDVTPRAAVALLRTAGAAVVLDALGGNRAYLAVTAAGAQNAAPLPALVFGTGDGGRTWAESAPLEIPAPASALSFAGPDDGWLLANYGGTMGQDPVWLYRTTDAGLRWSLVAAAPPSGTGGSGLSAGCDKGGLAFVTAQVGWLASACSGVSPDVLLVTRDGGARWAPQPLPVPASALCRVGCEAHGPPQFSGQDGFVVIGDGPDAPYFLASHDLGLTWQPEPLPQGAGRYPRIRFFGPRDGVLVAAGASGAVGRVFDTTADGGRTWTPVRQGGSFTALGAEFDFVSPRTGFAWVPGGDAPAGPPAMGETTDSGRTWTSFTPVLAGR